jgi:CheY-like chemotaxis protein
VLIIEDNNASATALKTMLLKLKLPSQVVIDTSQIIDLMLENTIKMILMTCKSANVDCTMTTTLIRQFEQEHQRAPIPIIGLTAHLTPDEKQQSFTAGMNAHLAKPVDIHALQLTIKAWQ